MKPFVFFLLVCPAVWAADTLGIPPTFTGNWHWKFTMPDGTEVSPTVKLTQDGDKVTGVSRLRSGTEAHITNGVVSGDTVVFEVVRRHHGDTVVTRYAGTREGNLIHGKVESNWSGDAQSYPWEARRQAGIEGTWKWTVEYRGVKYPTSVTLKMENGKLTGSMPGLGRNAKPVEIKNATYKDGDVEFEVERGNAQLKLHSRFQGKLQGDTIKGTTESTLGEAEPREDDWDAKRAE